MQTRHVVAVLAACLALVLSVAPGVVYARTSAQGHYPASQQFGGADGSIDTSAKVRAVMEYLSHRSSAEVNMTLGRLSPADRQNVIRQGLTVAYVEARRQPIFSILARSPHARPVKREVERETAVGKSLVGLEVYRYISEWSWCYNGRVVSCAEHHEYSDYSFPGWSYDGSQNLITYGKLNSWFYGREMVGTFHFGLKWFSSASYAKIQVQVNGAGGFWGWWKINGSI